MADYHSVFCKGRKMNELKILGGTILASIAAVASAIYLALAFPIQLPVTPPPVQLAKPIETVVVKTVTYRKQEPAWATATIVDLYLSEVYDRAKLRKDKGGDFGWKDPEAAKKVGKTLHEYAIGGMDKNFKELLYHAGKKMDEDGVRWAIISGFRDDYRQSIATGFKARTGHSNHGGSKATCGYGCGRAVDVGAETGSDTTPKQVFIWLDKNGKKYGLVRTIKGPDPVHVQPIGGWQKLATKLADVRAKKERQVAER